MSLSAAYEFAVWEQRGGRGGGGGGRGRGQVASGQFQVNEVKRIENEFDFVSSSLAFEKLAVKDEVVPAANASYDKKKSFFDNISCEASTAEPTYNRWHDHASCPPHHHFDA